jgi:hypothetical protein
MREHFARARRVSGAFAVHAVEDIGHGCRRLLHRAPGNKNEKLAEPCEGVSAGRAADAGGYAA